MLTLGPILLAVIVAVLVALSRRRSAPELGEPGAARPAQNAHTVSQELVGALDRAVGSGLLTREAAEAIVANEREHLLTEAAEHPGPRREVPALTEAIGYVGASLVMIGMAVLVGNSWDDLQSWARLAILGGVAVAFFVAGALLRDETEPVIWRLRNFVWLLAAGALAGFMGVLTADALSWEGEPVAIAIGASVAAFSGALWQLRDRPAQHLSTMVGLLIGVGGLMAWLDGAAAVGLAVLAIGAAWLGLARRDVLPPQVVAVVLGLSASLIGPAITAGSWEHAAPIIGVAVTVALVVLGSMVGQFLITGAGVVGLFAYVPYTLGVFFGDTVGAPVILLASGALLLIVMLVLLHAHHGPGHSTGPGPPMRPALH